MISKIIMDLTYCKQEKEKSRENQCLEKTYLYTHYTILKSFVQSQAVHIIIIIIIIILLKIRSVVVNF